LVWAIGIIFYVLPWMGLELLGRRFRAVAEVGSADEGVDCVGGVNLVMADGRAKAVLKVRSANLGLGPCISFASLAAQGRGGVGRDGGQTTP